MKKKLIIPLIAVFILAVLLVPVPVGVYKDGGTKVYASLTYKIVNWNRITANEIYSKKCVYFFPYNFKSIDSLWEMVNTKQAKNFVGTVIEINDSNVIVKPKEDSWVLNSSDKISFNVTKLEKLKVNVGDMVLVTFNGEIMESYPAQIVATKWEIYNAENPQYSFNAKILEITDNSVLVRPQGDGEGISGVDKVEFNTANLPDIGIKVGDVVEVSFNGQVMYSYPAQINALSWRLIS